MYYYYYVTCEHSQVPLSMAFYAPHKVYLATAFFVLYLYYRIGYRGVRS
jgi:hypothetical protein